MGAVRIEVECHEGYRGAERPRAVALEGRRLIVAAVLDRWIEPDFRFFKLRLEGGATCVVRHDERADTWELTNLVRP